MWLMIGLPSLFWRISRRYHPIFIVEDLGRRTIFLSGVHPDTPAEELKKSFTPFGPVERVDIEAERHIAKLIFASPHSVAAAFKALPHTQDGTATPYVIVYGFYVRVHPPSDIPEKQPASLSPKDLVEFGGILSKLDGTRASIKRASAWVADHLGAAHSVCTVLEQSCSGSVPFSHRLQVLYLLSDVLHVGWRGAAGADEFVHAAKDVVLPIITAACVGESAQHQEQCIRVLELWKHRSIFAEALIDSWKGQLMLHLGQGDASLKILLH